MSKTNVEKLNSKDIFDIILDSEKNDLMFVMKKYPLVVKYLQDEARTAGYEEGRESVRNWDKVYTSGKQAGREEERNFLMRHFKLILDCECSTDNTTEYIMTRLAEEIKRAEELRRGKKDGK